MPDYLRSWIFCYIQRHCHYWRTWWHAAIVFSSAMIVVVVVVVVVRGTWALLTADAKVCATPKSSTTCVPPTLYTHTHSFQAAFPSLTFFYKPLYTISMSLSLFHEFADVYIYIFPVTCTVLWCTFFFEAAVWWGENIRYILCIFCPV